MWWIFADKTLNEGMLQPVLGGYQKRDENQPGFQVDFHLEYLRVSLTVMPFLKVIKRLSLGWEPPIWNLFHFKKIDILSKYLNLAGSGCQYLRSVV
jgi:hypothetical protein